MYCHLNWLYKIEGNYVRLNGFVLQKRLAEESPKKTEVKEAEEVVHEENQWGALLLLKKRKTYVACKILVQLTIEIDVSCFLWLFYLRNERRWVWGWWSWWEAFPSCNSRKAFWLSTNEAVWLSEVRIDASGSFHTMYFFGWQRRFVERIRAGRFVHV